MILMLRTICFKIGFWLINIIYGSISLIIVRCPRRYHKSFLLNYGAVIKKWLHVCCRLDSEIIGQENIPDQQCIILSKHSSVWETIILTCFFDIPITVAKQSLMNIPFFGWLFRLSHPILIDRSKSSDAMKQVLQLGKQSLDQGQSVFMFPEGTRAKPGEHVEYKAGGFLLAKKAGYAVLPVAHNAGKFWSNSRFVIYPGMIKVVIAPPLDSQTLSIKEMLQQTQQWIESTVSTLSEEKS